MEEIEDESSFGAYYEYLAVAGELNPFIILGISPVVGLIIEDVSIAYNRTLWHVQNQENPSLPPIRGPQVFTASQITATWAGLAATQAKLNRSVRKWKNETKQT